MGNWTVKGSITGKTAGNTSLVVLSILDNEGILREGIQFC